MSSANDTRPMAPEQLARRAEIGREKRMRTRAALVEAAQSVIARKGPDAPSIDDFIAAAGVAKGTFYNHFETREELLKAVAAELADEFNVHILDMLQGQDDPAARLAFAMRYFIDRAAREPTWGAVIVRIGLVEGPLGDLMARGLQSDVGNGIRSSRFVVRSAQAAADIALGSGLMGMRTVIAGLAGPEHGSTIAAAVLCALGVPRAEAARISKLKLRLRSPVSSS